MDEGTYKFLQAALLVLLLIAALQAVLALYAVTNVSLLDTQQRALFVFGEGVKLSVSVFLLFFCAGMRLILRVLRRHQPWHYEKGAWTEGLLGGTAGAVEKKKPGELTKGKKGSRKRKGAGEGEKEGQQGGEFRRRKNRPLKKS